MPQVLKKEIKKKIFDAACEVFFEKDFRRATIREIAQRAGVSTGLVYSYYRDKEALFDEAVEPVFQLFEVAMEEEEELSPSIESASERFLSVGNGYLSQLLSWRKELILLMDRSGGTRHWNAKERLISLLEEHIRRSLEGRGTHWDDLVAHIMATHFTEGVLEIARHYQGPQWADKMQRVLIQYYFKGVDSLSEEPCSDSEK